MAHGKQKKNKNIQNDIHIDTNEVSSVIFNEEFRSNVPLYFIDSGVVITFGMIKLLKEANIPESRIKEIIIRGSNKTVNGEPLEGNPSNIDEKCAEMLMQIYNDNQRGKAAICIVPAVYKETMIDGLKHDNTRRKFVRKFVESDCFLAFPNESIKSFALKTAGLQEKLKTVKFGEYGLNPEYAFWKKKKTNNPKELRDENFEDRLILAQTAVIAKQGLPEVIFISCSTYKDSNLSNQKNEEVEKEEDYEQYVSQNNYSKKIAQYEKEIQEAEANKSKIQNEIINLHNQSYALNDSDLSVPPKSGNGISISFVQINSRDFGKHKGARHGANTIGKDEVAKQIDAILEQFFNEDGMVEVCTPDQLSR